MEQLVSVGLVWVCIYWLSADCVIPTRNRKPVGWKIGRMWVFFLHLNYLLKKSKYPCRAKTFLWGCFPECLPSFDAVKWIVTHGEMEHSRVATPHAQQGTWLFLPLSSNHAAPFLIVTPISFRRSMRDGKSIMHCGAGEISSFKKQTTSTRLSFVGFSLP